MGDIIELQMAARSPRKSRTPALKRSIPINAREKLVRPCHRGGGGIQPREMECFIGRKLVGRRSYNEHDQLVQETPLRNGKPHGLVIWWDDDGSLNSTEPVRNGLAHGIARQYHDGKVVGAYVMKNGVGVDVWRQPREDGVWSITEIWWVYNKHHHCICWMLNDDEKTLWSERIYGGQGETYFEIEREWNSQGKMGRGYPKYMVGGKHVPKRQYLAACKNDKALPVLRESDQRPRRKFPPEVVRAMTRKPK